MNDSSTSWSSKTSLVLPSVILAGGLIIATLIGGTAMWRIKRLDQSSLSVTGYAVQQVVSDKAQWELNISSTGNDREAAYASLSKDIATVRGFLLSHGLVASEVSETSINVNRVYKRLDNGNTTNDIVGYEMSKAIKVSSLKVPVITRLVTQVESLLTSGVSFTLQPPQYLYTKLESKKLEMLAKATENAKSRASHMARSTQNNIGPLLSASSGVFQISPVDSTEVSDYGMNDTSTVNKDIRAVVNATFMVE
jgi:uncharacterized protein